MYPYTTQGPAVDQRAAAAAQQAVALMQGGIQQLSPERRAELQKNIAVLNTPAWQDRLAATPAVAQMTPDGVQLMTLLVSLGLQLSNQQLMQNYGYLVQARATVGFTTGAYDPRMVMHAAPAFGANPLTGHQTAGARLRFGQQTMTARSPY